MQGVVAPARNALAGRLRTSLAASERRHFGHERRHFGHARHFISSPENQQAK
jgi:hypothetical protein